MDGVQKLWWSVVFQALIDAKSSTNPSTPKEQNLNKLRKRHAIWWITSSNKDFYEVCSNANLDPDIIRESYLKFSSKGDAS